jgi:hypothetical protein
MLQLTAVSLALQFDAFATCRNAPPVLLRQATMTLCCPVCATASAVPAVTRVIVIKKRKRVPSMASPSLNAALARSDKTS